ncbi:MAG: ClpXP protease specificity-enhancing factor SspB [Pseudolabrys sp.]|nr:ClpXP protease specificity-enhancing factor SspB [Pseudolabrys sp.]
MADHIRYDLLTQQALRGVVRNVLIDVAKTQSLPGDHHFYISFDTRADGVRMSDRLRAQYPEEITIILQHQFWGLAVHETSFEVGLSFGGVPEKLTVPFAAINEFVDPSVQFGLRFEEVLEGAAPADAAPDKPARKKRPTSVPSSGPTPAPASPALAAPPQTKTPPLPAPPAATAPGDDTSGGKPDKPTNGGGEVVRLDRFRKK